MLENLFPSNRSDGSSHIHEVLIQKIPYHVEDTLRINIIVKCHHNYESFVWSRIVPLLAVRSDPFLLKRICAEMLVELVEKIDAHDPNICEILTTRELIAIVNTTTDRELAIEFEERLIGKLGSDHPLYAHLVSLRQPRYEYLSNPNPYPYTDPNPSLFDSLSHTNGFSEAEKISRQLFLDTCPEFAKRAFIQSKIDPAVEYTFSVNTHEHIVHVLFKGVDMGYLCTEIENPNYFDCALQRVLMLRRDEKKFWATAFFHRQKNNRDIDYLIDYLLRTYSGRLFDMNTYIFEQAAVNRNRNRPQPFYRDLDWGR